MASYAYSFKWLFLIVQSVTAEVSVCMPSSGNSSCEVSLFQRQAHFKRQTMSRNQEEEANGESNAINPDEYRKYAKKVADVEWNWVLIKLLNVSNVPKDFWFGTGEVDMKVSAAMVGTDLDAGFGEGKLQQYVWPAQDDTGNPTWDHIGLLAFKKDSATHIEIQVVDVDVGLFSNSDDVLISAKIPMPSHKSSWGAGETLLSTTVMCKKLQAERKECKQEGTQMSLQLQFFDQPIMSLLEHKAMDLSEKIIHLKEGDITGGANRASLAFKEVEGNTKAVLYVPGRSDSFAHPHVLQLFLSQGFDLYTLDSRRCGRNRKYLDDPRLGHHSNDFDEYFEEIDFSLDFMKSQKNYTKIVGYMHSTGAPLLLNYIMKKGDQAFSAFILNGPFLDWGTGLTNLQEHALEKLSAPLGHITELFGYENPVFAEGKGINVFSTKRWIPYRWSLDSFPLEATSVTVGWAAAVSKVQKELAEKKSTGITTKPTFVVSSHADTVLEHDESIAHCKWVNKACVVQEMQHNAHDVTMSVTEELNDEALAIIKGFLREADEQTQTKSIKQVANRGEGRMEKRRKKSARAEKRAERKAKREAAAANTA
eukprot:gnl/MRDRNA2_/MRDRNA2_115526_c0_seq1.p1 gnl/MRDRNA2_/MRDRNA2_115526_c0~~gnl/MRDRNA2_/MRDRNA2_115526_c0_seq1.p1  ORF type:complete len:593 (+),score=118.06 gnl/MRDRNA2_/MRDRNA2_115526_c0_seq1:113-1891(+)